MVHPAVTPVVAPPQEINLNRSIINIIIIIKKKQKKSYLNIFFIYI
jgi:hypothetical protein